MVFTSTTEAFGIFRGEDPVEAWDTVEAQGVANKVKVGEPSICVCPSYLEFAASNLRAIARILQDGTPARAGRLP
jgi:hypothetical protein